MTAPAVTTLRQTLATCLAANTTYQVFAFPPATILANSVVVIPDDPYLEPSNDSWATVGPTANFKLLITVPLFDNQGNLQGIGGRQQPATKAFEYSIQGGSCQGKLFGP